MEINMLQANQHLLKQIFLCEHAWP